MAEGGGTSGVRTGEGCEELGTGGGDEVAGLEGDPLDVGVGLEGAWPEVGPEGVGLALGLGLGLEGEGAGSVVELGLVVGDGDEDGVGGPVSGMVPSLDKQLSLLPTGIK